MKGLFLSKQSPMMGRAIGGVDWLFVLLLLMFSYRDIGTNMPCTLTACLMKYLLPSSINYIIDNFEMTLLNTYLILLNLGVAGFEVSRKNRTLLTYTCYIFK